MSSQKQFEFCHQALEEVMWGRPASQEELDTWERLTRNKGKKGKKKWKVFTKKEKTKVGLLGLTGFLSELQSIPSSFVCLFAG